MWVRYLPTDVKVTMKLPVIHLYYNGSVPKTVKIDDKVYVQKDERKDDNE